MTEIKTLDEQIEELYEQAKTLEDSTPTELEEEIVEEPAEEDQGDDKLPEVFAPVETPDQRAMAQAQWEAREAKRQTAELQKRLEAIEAEKPKPKPVEDPEPNRDEEPLAYSEWKTRQLERKLEQVSSETAEVREWRKQQETQTEEQRRYHAAVQEFSAIQQTYEQQNPDYAQARSHMGNAIARRVQAENPYISQQDLISTVDKEVLRVASLAVNRNQHPIKVLHDMARDVYGFRPEPIKQPEPPKPSLEAIEKNKKKSVNGLGGSSGKAYVTPEAAVNLSIAELDKMSSEERQMAGYSY